MTTMVDPPVTAGEVMMAFAGGKFRQAHEWDYESWARGFEGTGFVWKKRRRLAVVAVVVADVTTESISFSICRHGSDDFATWSMKLDASQPLEKMS